MVKADVIKLIKDDPNAHGVFDNRTETRREVMCDVRSVGMTEAYTAMAHGLNPSLKFILALAEDYQGERRVEYHGAVYSVIRTYVDGDGIELTVERVD